MGAGMPWTRVCHRNDVEDGEAIQVRLPSLPAIAVYNVEDDFYATADTCTHDESSLADGYVEGHVVECAWHFAKFCLKTGNVLSPPATVGLRIFPIKVEGDDVFVEVPD
jgi:3-phenylpropionate/trans-cinnamate dioxygenase ferredoxin component